jgi:antitoxin ParD1/3/4
VEKNDSVAGGELRGTRLRVRGEKPGYDLSLPGVVVRRGLVGESGDILDPDTKKLVQFGIKQKESGMSRNTSITLGDHFEGFIASLIETGRFSSRSEVIRAALRSMEEQERKAETLAMMAQSMEDIREGRTHAAKPALRKIAEELGLKLDR